MKRWSCLLFICLGVVCLSLILGHQVAVNHGQHAGWDRSVDCWKESVPSSIRVLPATSTEFARSRAGPLESLATRCTLLTPVYDLGPPWLDQRGPPRACSGFGTYKAVGKAGSSKKNGGDFPNEIPSVNGPSQKAAFFNSL
jgi:hypothetical protein